MEVPRNIFFVFLLHMQKQLRRAFTDTQKVASNLAYGRRQLIRDRIYFPYSLIYSQIIYWP